ncbi:MAG: 23S rRNA (adenine(2503)-C(2))-methyltransferase RlmN, partial [Candidatus Heimdallarchaeota archaeon]|nr:23S rRNA (adenine(2503)-C(2))-methyltransferase RlmN [Candidatus Heimdallarchaeota archaeon]
SLNPEKTIRSKDRQTYKTLFRLKDGLAIETVLMMYEKRRTLCISTQAGCPIGCKFCATGQMGFDRNLSSGEIVEQVFHFSRILKEKDDHVTNIVFMGMGEPFNNYDATLDAVRRLNDPEGFSLGARKMTISTVGLIPQIRKFAKENIQVNLAISLHASDDELRSSIIPINKKYPIADLISACKEYINITNRRVTFEWALINEFNDTPEQANKLAQLLRGMLCHVNVIPLNQTDGFKGIRSVNENIDQFVEILESRKIPVSVRLRRGVEIQAGCGQLAYHSK